MNLNPWPTWYYPPPRKTAKYNRISSEAIIREACSLFDLSRTDFMGPCRLQIYRDARKAVVYVLHRRRPDLSWQQISRAIGRTDHSTAMSAFANAQKLVKESPEFSAAVLKLEGL